MPRFEPFAGLRYDTDRVDLDLVTAPPYDVIDEEGRQRLEALSPWNAVRVELSRDEPGRDRYQVALDHFEGWQGEDVLVADPDPSFYVVRMGFHDEQGGPRQTTGVVGALEVGALGESGVLPHERTMPKPKGDRLDLLRACRANLSPIWGLSLAEGLSGLFDVAGPPDARCTDELGVHHRLWRVSQPGVVDTIAGAVASTPVVIADGHHRFETARAYREEQRAANGGAPGPYDLVMTYVVELADEQLSVRAIHRLLGGLPAGLDLVAALEPFFEPTPADGPDETLLARMSEAGSLALVTPAGRWLLRPRPETDAAAEHRLDSSRLAVALAALPEHELWFQHGWDNVVRAVDKGEAQAGVLLRPATVAQIADTAHLGTPMPEKTTFFYPKVRTGLVFRRLA